MKEDNDISNNIYTLIPLSDISKYDLEAKIGKKVLYLNNNSLLSSSMQYK